MDWFQSTQWIEAGIFPSYLPCDACSEGLLEHHSRNWRCEFWIWHWSRISSCDSDSCLVFMISLSGMLGHTLISTWARSFGVRVEVIANLAYWHYIYFLFLFLTVKYNYWHNSYFDETLLWWTAFTTRLYFPSSKLALSLFTTLFSHLSTHFFSLSRAFQLNFISSKYVGALHLYCNLALKQFQADIFLLVPHWLKQFW